MTPLVHVGLIAVLLGAAVPATAGGPGDPPTRVAIRAGKILTMDPDDTVHDNAILFVADGKIERIVPARGAVIPAGYHVVDHSDHWLMPGLIDCHNHTATEKSNDLHDYVWLTNPGLRTMDLAGVDTDDNRRAIAGGVTSALMIPGSGTNMSGYGALLRLGADDAEEVISQGIASLKIAQAGNPERYYFGVGRSYMNFNLRQTLEKARDYHERWVAFEKGEVAEQPTYDANWDDFRKLFRGEIPASVHTQMFQVASKTMTLIHDEFGLATMIDHGTFDAYKAASLARDRGIYCIVGPRIWWMDEQDRTVNSCAGGWWDRGARRIGINTDSFRGGTPQEDLANQAAMSVKYGWKTYPALVGLTRIAAESLGLGDRIGSLRPKMDADIVAWSGNPLDARSSVEQVWVLGRSAYDVSRDKRRY